MYRVFVILLALILLVSCTKKEDDIFNEIIDLHQQGHFNTADSLISHYLAQNPDLDQSTVSNLKFEIERGKRIINDYLLTEDKFTSLLENRIEGFSLDEFRKWEDEGRFDILWVNGQKRYANPSVSNLFFRYPELRIRMKNRNTRSPNARQTLVLAKKLEQDFDDYPVAVLLPRKSKVKQTLKVKEGTIPPNEKVRCWLPYPSRFQTQDGIRFIQSNFNPKWVDYADSPIRSVYFEEMMPETGPLEFTIEYEYTAYAYYRKIDVSKVLAFDGREPEFQQYTREESPHILFTSKMKNVTEQIIGDEQNPYLKAKRIYEWIADSIKYSYAREYSTLRNISEYCYDNRYGDCGQEAILFITLCRIAGVPARWQSGFFTFPNDEGMHDWSEIFIKPYGWIPVDTYMGILFTSITEDLTAPERKQMREFYFGNIDHFRLVANKGHNLKLYPPKQHFRSETVDFQRGEVEWRGGNLYFPDWRWSLTVTEIKK
jgi:hypothetical protein